MFWKKDDDFDFDSMTDGQMKNDPLLSGSSSDPLNAPAADPFAVPPATPGAPDVSANPIAPPPAQTGSVAQPAAMQQQQEMRQSSSSGSSGVSSRDIELVSSKLDTIKALLASLDQRMANLEKVAGVEQKQKERLW